MFRKILVLLLLPCVLMSQSAVFGHAHGGSEPAGMDYVHTSTLWGILADTLTRIKRMVATVIILLGIILTDTIHMAEVATVTMKNASMPIPDCHR